MPQDKRSQSYAYIPRQPRMTRSGTSEELGYSRSYSPDKVKRSHSRHSSPGKNKVKQYNPYRVSSPNTPNISHSYSSSPMRSQARPSHSPPPPPTKSKPAVEPSLFRRSCGSSPPRTIRENSRDPSPTKRDKTRKTASSKREKTRGRSPAPAPAPAFSDQ
mmetsp:Transcript_3158/g.4593  ORF Transcript_3158/g.4593 Transcript_3158/m.4593 type:complete len:160 (-) Transcript_3158:2488-2967(-)